MCRDGVYVQAVEGIKEALRRDVQGTARDHPLGKLRAAERKRTVPRLHGALRVRAVGRAPHVRVVARIPRHRRGHRHRPVLSAGMTDATTLEGWTPQIGPG